MEVGWAWSAPHFIYIHHAPISRYQSLILFFSLLVFPLHVSQCLLSAFVVLITTYPELSRSSEMLQQSVLQETWNREHQLPQVFSDPSRNQVNIPGSSMKLVRVLESVAQFLRQGLPRLWSILILRVRLVPLSKILVCFLCRLIRCWTVLYSLRQFVRNTCRHIHLKTVIYSQPVHVFLHLTILRTSSGQSLLKVTKQSFRRLCRSLLQQSANYGSQKGWKLLMIWPACTRRHERSATIWTSTAWKINTLIPLLKAGLLPGDGSPVGRGTACADESARCFPLVPFQTTKYLRMTASVKSAQATCLLSPIRRFQHRRQPRQESQPSILPRQ